MSKRKCFGHCYKYRDCEGCPDFDDCYTATAKKTAEDVWDWKPDIKQMMIDVRWLSNAALNRTPCQNQFRGLLSDLEGIKTWLDEVKKQMDWFKGKADQLDAIIKLHPVAGDITIKEIVTMMENAVKWNTIPGEAKRLIEENPKSVIEAYASLVKYNSLNNYNHELLNRLKAIKKWGKKWFPTFRHFKPIAELEEILFPEGEKK